MHFKPTIRGTRAARTSHAHSLEPHVQPTGYIDYEEALLAIL